MDEYDGNKPGMLNYWVLSFKFMMAYKYDWKKTGVKVVTVAAEVVVAGMIAYAADRAELIFLAPVFEAILDYIKHRKV